MIFRLAGGGVTTTDDSEPSTLNTQMVAISPVTWASIKDASSSTDRRTGMLRAVAAGGNPKVDRDR